MNIMFREYQSLNAQCSSEGTNKHSLLIGLFTVVEPLRYITVWTCPFLSGKVSVTTPRGLGVDSTFLGVDSTKQHLLASNFFLF